jgi:hypothetical protein
LITSGYRNAYCIRFYHFSYPHFLGGAWAENVGGKLQFKLK